MRDRERERETAVCLYVHHPRPVEIPGALGTKPAGERQKRKKLTRGVVAIMRFMAAENVVAIIPDNAGGVVVAVGTRLLVPPLSRNVTER